MYRTVFWTLWEREGAMIWEHCQSRFDAGYRKLGAGALGRPRGMVRGGRREGGSGWGTRIPVADSC